MQQCEMQQKRKVSFASHEEGQEQSLPTLYKARQAQVQEQGNISRTPPRTQSMLPPPLGPPQEQHPSSFHGHRHNTNLLELSQMFEQMQVVNNRGESCVNSLLGFSPLNVLPLGVTPLNLKMKSTSSPSTTPDVTKPRKLEPLNHKIPQGRNNQAGLRLPVNYSGKWRDWNEPEIFGLQDLQNNNKTLL